MNSNKNHKEKMLANIYGYGDENGKIIFNVPDELKRAGMLKN